MVKSAPRVVCAGVLFAPPLPIESLGPGPHNLAMPSPTPRSGGPPTAECVPPERLRPAVSLPPDRRGDYVLYWMVAQRRARSNFGLQRAAELAEELDRPLLVLEALRAGHRWANARHHAFVLAGMADNRRAFEAAGVRYHAYVEPEAGAGRGLLAALAARACAVVSDFFPCYFLPAMAAAWASRSPVRFELVDGNGLLPIPEDPKAFPNAYAFRRHLQRELAPHLAAFPVDDPLAGRRLPAPPELPKEVLERWPEAPDALLAAEEGALAGLAVDRQVAPSAVLRGGREAGRERLARFLKSGLSRYAGERSEPASDAASGLSPYLHYGHVGAHEVAAAVLAGEGWSARDLGPRADGKRAGWWGLSENAESFLDELVTWRELGYHFCAARPGDYDRFEALPDFARRTLTAHANDRREHVYSREQFAAAETHDELWNAAQRQLAREGRMHNYMRMLWGKKVLEWTKSPEEALEILIELNNRYALDGRNPNSYSGIGWVLGRFDRPWGPERPIYGTVRYMSSDNTRRKFDVKPYLAAYGTSAAQGSLYA